MKNGITYVNKKEKLSDLINDLFSNIDSKEITKKAEFGIMFNQLYSNNQKHIFKFEFQNFTDYRSFKTRLRGFIEYNSDNYILFEVYKESFSLYKLLVKDYTNTSKTVNDYIEKLKSIFGYIDKPFDDYFIYFGDLIKRNDMLFDINANKALLLQLMNWFVMIRHHQVSKMVLFVFYTEFMSTEEITAIKNITKIMLTNKSFGEILILLL